MCSSHALFLCARNTAQKERRRERERENTTIIVQKEESSSRDAVQERTRTGQKPETREIESNRAREKTVVHFHSNSQFRGRKALLL
mgnify:CR=1 FL=1